MTERGAPTVGDVVAGLSRLIADDPSTPLTEAQVGARRPALPSDLPFLAVALRIEEPRVRGLSRLIDGERRAPRPGDASLAERRAYSFGGLATLEMWGPTDRVVMDGARRIGKRLADRAATRRHGFLTLEPAGLAPAEHATRPAAAGSDFAAWSQRLEYRFHFEPIPVPEEGGGIIERIDVDLSHLPDPGPEDELVIPAEPRT